jgi:hypothetical protein
MLVAVFQLALAAGAPLGYFAWGGAYEGVLPTPLRWASLGSAGILGLAIWLLRRRTDHRHPPSPVIHRATWILTAFLILNTIGNLASASPAERITMTPFSVTLAVCVLIVARSPQHWR